MARIEDGTGSGVFAAVTADNKIAVQAESIPSLAVASASREDAYVVNTGSALFAITTGAERGVIYVQNTSPFPLSVGGISASVSATIAATAPAAGVFRLYREPSSAIATVTTPVTPVQLNFGSSKGFTGTALIGDGSTAYGGGGTALAVGAVQTGFSELQLAGAAILQTADTIAVTYEDLTGGASSVSVNLICAYLAG